MSPMLHKKAFGGRFMGLFVGTHGSGKTVAIGSMPGPILIFDFDGRVDSIKLFHPLREDIEYFTVGLEDRSRDDVISLNQFMDKLDDLKVNCPYATVAIDSYTMYSTVAVLAQMGFKEDSEIKQKKTKGGLPIPDWDEYKGETGVAVDIMETAKIIPAHFIMTAHPVSKAQTTKQGGGDTNEALASMVRASTLATYGWKTVSILPSYFNEMYYFDTDVSSQAGNVNRRYVQTVSAGEIVAKTALPLPKKFEITDRPFWPIIESVISEYKARLDAKRAERDSVKL